jgi:hypothetical protein
MKGILFAALFIFIASGICVAADQPDLVGTYISKKDSKDYLTLSPDGSFYLKQHKAPPDPMNPYLEVSGRYEKVGDTLKLKLPDGGEATGTMKGNTFEDGSGVSWVKEGTEVNKLERPKPIRRTY